MKKARRLFLFVNFIVVPGLILISSPISGQETSKESPALPENIHAIVTASCMPCHSAKGGLMARSKLNFTDWTKYSSAKQKEKAEKMVSMLIKGAMPPKSVREKHPETIPNQDQINTIKKWSESLNTCPDVNGMQIKR